MMAFRIIALAAIVLRVQVALPLKFDPRLRCLSCGAGARLSEGAGKTVVLHRVAWRRAPLSMRVYVSLTGGSV